MVASCSAYKCTNRRTKDSRISFHRFPRDPEHRRKWIVATRRKNFVPTNDSRLCSKHFTKDQFQIRPNCNYELLKIDAVPSLFDFPDDQQKAPRKKRRTTSKTLTCTQTSTCTSDQPATLQAQSPVCADPTPHPNDELNSPSQLPKTSCSEELPKPTCAQTSSCTSDQPATSQAQSPVCVDPTPQPNDELNSSSQLHKTSNSEELPKLRCMQTSTCTSDKPATSQAQTPVCGDPTSQPNDELNSSSQLPKTSCSEELPKPTCTQTSTCTSDQPATSQAQTPVCADPTPQPNDELNSSSELPKTSRSEELPKPTVGVLYVLMLPCTSDQPATLQAQTPVCADPTPQPNDELNSSSELPKTRRSKELPKPIPDDSQTKELLRRKVKILQQRLKRRDSKIKSMKNIICVLKKKLKIQDKIIDLLENNYSGFP